MTTTLLPGDVVSPSDLPASQKSNKALTLGPGLHFTPPSTISASVAGSLQADNRKNALWLETNGAGRYVPTVGDLVIAQVHHSATELYYCSLSPYTPHASLNQLAFEGASRKTRPQLQSGSLVYARVSYASRHMEPEIECVQPSTGKSEGLGELKGGMLFDVSLGLARRLMMTKSREDGGVAILEEAAERGAKFEIAVGRNGKVWIDSFSIKLTLVIGQALKETDEKNMDVNAQVKLVRKLLKDIV